MTGSWLTFFRHSPCAAVAEVAPATRLRVTACAGEMASASVTVRAAETIGAVGIGVSPLRDAAGATIPDAAVDVFVVREWDQAGIGVYQGERVRVAELLLKDDVADLRDGYQRGCEHWRHLHRGWMYYAPPDVRLHGPARATLRAGTARQVWIAIRIPADTSAGVYRGEIEVSARNKSYGAARLPIEIEVLGLELAESSRDLLLFYRGTLDCRQPRFHVPPAVFRAQLEDIHAHGFRSLSLSEGDPELLQRAIDVAYEVGFRDRVLLLAPIPPRLDRIEFRSLRPMLYISDEIDVRGPDTIGAHVANWQDAARRRFPTMCALVQEQFARRLFDPADIGHPPDALLYFLPRNLEYFALLANAPEIRRRPTYYYWQAYMEKPLVHRVLAGAYLWKSGADGIAPYCYQHLPEPPNLPFDDFDVWDEHESALTGGGVLKDHLVTYPARRGSIPTVQWKGMSAGLYDLRYLETFGALRAEASERGGAAADLAGEVARELEGMLARMPLREIEITSSTEARPYQDLDASDLEALRDLVARGALELRRLL